MCILNRRVEARRRGGTRRMPFNKPLTKELLDQLKTVFMTGDRRQRDRRRRQRHISRVHGVEVPANQQRIPSITAQPPTLKDNINFLQDFRQRSLSLVYRGIVRQVPVQNYNRSVAEGAAKKSKLSCNMLCRNACMNT